MEEIYEYNGKEYTKSQLDGLAKQSGVSFNDYIVAIGATIKQSNSNNISNTQRKGEGTVFDLGYTQQQPTQQVSNEEYLYNNKTYSFDQLNNLAQQSGVSFDDYTKALNIKKKGGGTTPQATSSEVSKLSTDAFADFNPSLGKKNPTLEATKRLANLNSPYARTTQENTEKINTVLSRNGLGIEKIATQLIPDQVTMFMPDLRGKTFGEVANTNEGRSLMAKLAKQKLEEEVNVINQKGIPQGKFATDFMWEKSNALSKEDEVIISQKRNEISELEKIEYDINKASTDVTGETIKAVVRTDQSGNSLKRFVNLYSKLGGSPLPQLLPDFTAKIQELPAEFMVGLDFLSRQEPADAKRVMTAIAEGKPISDAQKATIINMGLEIVNDRIANLRANGAIAEPEYLQENKVLFEKRINNTLNSPETLRALLSNGIAEEADAAYLGMEKAAGVSDGDAPTLKSRLFGFKWNYSDDEIAQFANIFARKNGLDVNDARFKSAVKYLQDNEGVMIGSNSIYKAGWVRDFGEGLSRPIVGTLRSIEVAIPEAVGGRSTEEIYAEAQSQASTEVAKQPVKRATEGVDGAVSKIAQGFGEFASQVFLTRGYGTALGGVANMATRDLLSTSMMAFGQSFESNYKQALSYTDNDFLATTVATGLSGLEGLVENIKSPIEVSRTFQKVFRSPKTNKEVIDVLTNKNILNKREVLGDYLRATVRGAFESGKVIVGEQLEETITQIADYGVNYLLNPQSVSFQNRDLLNEIGDVVVETGLSMVIPALMGGVGAYNANNFEKGTLLIAAQNRQRILDDMNVMLSEGNLTQDEYNERVSVVNTVAKINDNLPLKVNGSKLTTDEKADYIFSRATEAALEQRIEKSNDQAEKNILTEKVKQQQNYRTQILQNENAEDATNETEQQVTETENIETEVANSEVATNATPSENLEVGDIIRNVSGDLGVIAEFRDGEVVVSEVDNPNMTYVWRNDRIDLTNQKDLAEQNISRRITALEQELQTIEDDNNPRIQEIDIQISQLESQRDAINTQQSPLNAQDNAIQEQSATQEMLGNEGVRGESGLQGVGEGNQTQEPTQQSQEAQEAWDKDVESIAKALDGVDKKKLTPMKMVGQLTKDLPNKGDRKRLKTPMGDVGDNYNVGDVEVTLSEDFDFGELNGEEQQADVSINFIGVTKKDSLGKGLASKELDRIIALADTRGMSLSLIIDPQGATFGVEGLDKVGLLNSEQLKEWYGRKGFLFDEDSSYGFRPAKNKKQLAEAYHKAKADDSNPQLVKAVEEILGTPNNSQNENVSSQQQNLKQNATEIIVGKKVFKRFSQEEQRGFTEGGRANVEASLLLAANEGTGREDNTTPQAQEDSIEQYAKENNIWIDDTTEYYNSKYGEPIGAGEEAMVWGDETNGRVIKTQDTFQYPNLQQKLDSISLHNSYFPESRLTVIGFGRNSNGDFQVIVEQPFIQGEKVTLAEIKSQLESVGFEKDENNDNYRNDNVIIEDVHTGNALKTPKGNIVIIDPIMRLNTTEQGYGGNRIVDNTIEETTQPEQTNEQQTQPTEGITTTTEVSEPIQSNEPTTQEQGNQEAVQQDTATMERGTTETTNAVLRKSLADRIREGKINDDIAMSGVPFLKEVWNGALEAVALSIEAGDSLRKSINKGLSHIRNSDWYKGLSDEHKTRAENRFRDEYDDLVGDLIDTNQKIGNKEVDDAIDSIVATGEVNDYLSGDTIEKRTSERPTSNQQYNSTVLEDAFKQGFDVVEAAKAAYGKQYVSKLLDYLKNANMDVGKKALIYVSLRNDLYLRRLQATPEQYQSIVKEQEAVYLQSQDFAHQNAIAMNMWRLQNIQKYGYDINEITEKLFTPTENEQRAKVAKAVQVNDDAVNKEADINSDAKVGSKDPDIAKEAEEEKAKVTKDNRKRSSKKKWQGRKVTPDKLDAMLKSVKERINKLNCK